MSPYRTSAREPAPLRYTFSRLLGAQAIVLSLALLPGCPAAVPIVNMVSTLVCGALTVLLSPTGAFWGTACSGLAKAIEAEIAADTSAPVAAARAATETSCARANLVPVPGFESVAMVCPGFEAAAARGAAKGLAASKAVGK